MRSTDIFVSLATSFEFDASGDTTAGGVAIYRIDQGKPRVIDVITRPKSLR